jgi:adenylate cyclase
VRPIYDVTVKARRSKIPIYELLGLFGADDPELEPDAATLELCRMTRLAYEALIKEDHTLAWRRYREILAKFPDDPVSSILAKRLVTA